MVTCAIAGIVMLKNKIIVARSVIFFISNSPSLALTIFLRIRFDFLFLMPLEEVSKAAGTSTSWRTIHLNGN